MLDHIPLRESLTIHCLGDSVRPGLILSTMLYTKSWNKFSYKKKMVVTVQLSYIIVARCMYEHGCTPKTISSLMYTCVLDVPALDVW